MTGTVGTRTARTTGIPPYETLVHMLDSETLTDTRRPLTGSARLERGQHLGRCGAPRRPGQLAAAGVEDQRGRRAQDPERAGPGRGAARRRPRRELTPGTVAGHVVQDPAGRPARAQNAEENCSNVARSPRCSSYAVPASTLAPRVVGRSLWSRPLEPLDPTQPRTRCVPRNTPVGRRPPRPESRAPPRRRPAAPRLRGPCRSQPRRRRRIPVPRLAGCAWWCSEPAGSAAPSAPACTRRGTTSRWSPAGPTVRRSATAGSPSPRPRSG